MMAVFFALTTGLLIGLIVGFLAGISMMDAHIKRKEKEKREQLD